MLFFFYFFNYLEKKKKKKMGICANTKQKKLPKNFTQNDKEFESFDFSSPKGKEENSAIPV